MKYSGSSKSELERLLLIEKIKLEKANWIVNYVKSLCLLVGSIFLFLLVTLPESILNKSISEENLKREKVKLILEVIKEKDPEIRASSMIFLKEYYPAISVAFGKLESEIIDEGIEDLKKKREKIILRKESSSDPRIVNDLRIDSELLELKIRQLEQNN